MVRRLHSVCGGAGMALAAGLTAACGCTAVALHSRSWRPEPDSRFGIRFATVAGCTVPEDVHRVLPAVASLAVRDSDIFVVSFPKSGTTWVQELVYMIVSDMDRRSAESVSIEERFPFLEFAYPGVGRVAEMRREPRLIKSHLPAELLPPGLLRPRQGQGKVIYVARNPKDVCVSYHHFVRLLRPLLGYAGDLRDFADAFLRELPLPYGPWRQHVLSYWQLSRQRDNVLFVTYEQLSADTVGCVLRIAEFLGRSLSRRQAERVAEFCSFHRMRSRPATSYTWWRACGLHDPALGFYRSGRVGDWRDHLLPDEVARFDAMLEDIRHSHGLDLRTD